MSLLPDYSYAEISTFGGPDLLTDHSMVPIHRALLARNVEYSAGSVGTRHGYAGIQALPAYLTAIYELYNWIGPFSQITPNYVDSALVIINQISSRINIYNLNTTTLSGLMASSQWASGSSCAGCTVIGVGMRLYLSQVDGNQNGLTGGESLTLYNNGGTVQARGGGFTVSLFCGPTSYSPTITEPSAGVVTAGLHRFGYLVEFSDGFTTKVSPDNSGNAIPSLSSFAPISFTASGSKNAHVAFGASWNATSGVFGEMVAVSLVMTTITDLNQYYIVPGSRTPLATVGSLNAFNIDVNISDSDLESQGIDATPYLYWFTSSPSASQQPFKTKHIALLGNRMGYLARQPDNNGSFIDCLFISEQNNYQAITADQHIFQLPGQRPMTTMFRMGSLNYILGPHEIWAATDNNDVPASWSAASLLDGRHGTQSIHGVEVAPSGNYAWIADQAGLYLFSGGPITSLPISYYQTPDWNRINWAAAFCLKIRDDAGNKRLHVMVPLDGSSTPNFIMTWDYTNGITPDAVMYSLDSLSGYPLGAMELVRNNLLNQDPGNAGKIELWVGSSGTNNILRKTSDSDLPKVFTTTATLTHITVASNVATALTVAAHGLYAGESVTVSGATVHPALNNSYTIFVTGPFTFTFPTSGVVDGTYTEAGLSITVSPWQDNGAPINSSYRTSPLPGRGVTEGQILMHHGFHARLKGEGAISPTIYDIDATHNYPCATFALSATPDQDTLALARIRNELAFAEFSTNHVGHHWILSYLRWYYSQYLVQR